MGCCCTSVYKFCDLIICDDQDLVLPIPVPADGDYTFDMDFLNDVVRKSATLTAGDNATFDKDGLNEQFTYVGSVKDASGVIVSFTIEDIVYDCIEFTTKRAV